jgi:hypothetical protein
VTSQDRIRELCAQAITATDDEARNIILPQLKDALREHLKNLRRMVAAEYPFHKDVAAD